MPSAKKTLRSICLPFTIAALGFVSSPEVFAGGKRTVTVDDFDDFDAGESEGAAIEGSGKLTAGYTAIRTEVQDATSVFRCYSSAKRTWMGTADQSAIYQVKEGKKKQAIISKFVDLKGAVVSAMTELPNGDLLAATLPGGEIHQINKHGRVSTFAKLDVEQIWAMKVHQGRLLVGTGPKGELYSLALRGSDEKKDAKVILDVPETDILSLLSVDKHILAGTSTRARLYMVGHAPKESEQKAQQKQAQTKQQQSSGKDKSDDKKKKTDKKLSGILLQEFEGDEIHRIALAGSQLVVIVNDFSDRGVSSLQSLTKQLKRSSLTGEMPSDNKVAATTPASTAYVYAAELNNGSNNSKKLDIQRAADSAWEQWLKKRRQYFTDLTTQPTSSKGQTPDVLVSSSKDGKVYRLRGRRDVSTIADLDERIATSLCRWRGRILATAGDGAAAYSLNPQPAKKANYISKVFDAGQPALYGAAWVEGSGAIQLQMRTGPGKEVDSRWTSWKTVSLKKGGENYEGQAKLPHRRYFQFKVILANSNSEVRSVRLAFAPENLPPLITSVDVKQPSFSKNDDHEPKPKATIKWSVDARDDDELSYDVEIRPEGRGNSDDWTPLNDEGPISKRELELDLDSIPEGTYEVAVTASDEPENGSAGAQRDRALSDPFLIDRTRPQIIELKIQGRRVLGKARDGNSHIHDVAVRLDSGDFRNASPSDGIFDESEESFRFELPDSLRSGRHRIVVRVRDARGNLTTRALIQKIE